MEKPILFTPFSVQAILDGRKSQTRRICKPQPYPDLDDRLDPIAKGILLDTLRTVKYQKGMILWVRETWAPLTVGYAYRADGIVNENFPGTKWHPSIFMPKAASRIKLEITDIRIERLQNISEEDARAEGIIWEELSDGYKSIGEWYKDYSRKKGANKMSKTWCANAVESYKTLWESINGKGSWEKNPWVWCISFKRL